MVSGSFRSIFQSTFSVRRATVSLATSDTSVIFQSTFSVRRATVPRRGLPPLDAISIHVLREESDGAICSRQVAARGFQSTFSVRRATQYRHHAQDNNDISIHVLREESDHRRRHRALQVPISIHVLREESDPLMVSGSFRSIFQSTFSVRRATRDATGTAMIAYISIHVLREESDAWSRPHCSCPTYFNPRSP